MCGEQTKKVVANNNIQMRAGFGHDAKIFRFYNAAVNRRHRRRRRSLQRAIILCAQRAAICTPPPVPQYSHKLARHRVYYTRGHRFRLEIGTENVYKKKTKTNKKSKVSPVPRVSPRAFIASEPTFDQRVVFVCRFSFFLSRHELNR